MGSPNENGNWVFDLGLIEDIPVLGGELPSLETPAGALWSSSSFPETASISVEIDGSFGNSVGLKETGYRKRTRSASCSGNANGSKACREKMRRDKLNDRFMELSAVLDPGRPPKTDKSQILTDAVKMVNQLRDEAQKLKECNESLHEKVAELKVEKNELREEKQRLKTEKENIERQVKAMSAPAGFLPHPPPPAMAAPFSHAGQVLGSKMMPYVSYPGYPMWQFIQPAILDTSEDSALHAPVA